MGNYVILFLVVIVAAGLIFALTKIKLKPFVKIAAVLLLIFDVLFGLRTLMTAGIIATPAAMKSLVPSKTGSLAGSVGQAIPASYEVPAEPVTGFQGCPRMLAIAWNGAAPITLANGGSRTTDDSLVKKYSGGCLQVERQDDYGIQKDELVKFASGDQSGAAFTVMMGDAYAAYAQSLQERLKPLGEQVVVIGITGFSFGEDKVMGKPLNGNPKNALGSLLVGVPYDGDWNTMVKFASDNGLRVNARQDIYETDAINTVDVTMFTDANDKYVNGYTTKRKVYTDGKPTGEERSIPVDGVMTWFPGDRFVVTRGSKPLTTWASTREYNQQMPAVIITTKSWAEKNRPYIVGLLRAFDRASFQIRTADGIQKLGPTQVAVFGKAGGEEATPEFWSKAFASYDITTPQGNTVNVGGTRAVTLAEVRDYLGLSTGSLNTYKGAVYETFGDYAKQFYPKDVPTYPKYEDVVDPSFIQAALAGVNVGATASAFTERKSITTAVSERAYAIEFQVGSARLTGEGMRTLNGIANSAASTSLRIRIVGHTDNTGDSVANYALSRQRAQAVADALTALAPTTFPTARFDVQGLGDSSPLPGLDPSSAAGRAKNRRVEVALGN